MERQIYFTINGGEEQSIDANDATSPSEQRSLQAVADYLELIAVPDDRNYGAQAPTMSEQIAKTLKSHGVEILRVR